MAGELSMRTSMLTWWPPTKDLGIPVPDTEIIEVEPVEAEGLLYGCATHEPDAGCWDDAPGAKKADCVPLLNPYREAIEQAGERLGYPLFVRTDLTSGKHSWRDTCFVPDPLTVMRHVWAVVESHALISFPPRPGQDMRVQGIVLREFLTLDAPFKTFNGMPVARERRYFVDAGEVACYHPYWQDPTNIASGFPYGEEEPDRWREQLAALNVEPAAEVELLSAYARKVAQALPGAWSVDFALSEDGKWYLIDMAVAEDSWHPDHAGEAARG